MLPDPISLQYSLPYYILALIGGYLLGSIPFGVVSARLFGLGDIRKIGSGNIGATNVLRTGNKLAAITTLLGDGGKGAIAVLIAAMWGPVVPLFAALGAFVGHLWPIWLGFRGGKGVATYFGILLALYWPVGIFGLVTWLLVAVATRYSSLAALMTVLLVPSYFVIFDRMQLVGVAILIGALIFWKHRENISRLLAGTESKIDLKKRA